MRFMSCRLNRSEVLLYHREAVRLYTLIGLSVLDSVQYADGCAEGYSDHGQRCIRVLQSGMSSFRVHIKIIQSFQS